MPSAYFSAIVIAVSAFALWHWSTVGWIVAAVANTAAIWRWWAT